MNGKIAEFSWGRNSPRQPNCFCNDPNLLTQASLCLDSSPYAIFFQSLINADILFTSGIGQDILMKVLEHYIFLIWTDGFFKIVILSKNRHFQSGALLKIPPSSPSMEEFGLDIRK